LFLINQAHAYQISAQSDKITYAIGETLKITGTINTTTQVEITAKIYNSTTLMNTSVSNSSGTLINSFTISNKINDSYTQGEYFVDIMARPRQGLEV
jgi:NAD-dependent DNA ligase